MGGRRAEDLYTRIDCETVIVGAMWLAKTERFELDDQGWILKNRMCRRRRRKINRLMHTGKSMGWKFIGRTPFIHTGFVPESQTQRI